MLKRAEIQHLANGYSLEQHGGYCGLHKGAECDCYPDFGVQDLVRFAYIVLRAARND